MLDAFIVLGLIPGTQFQITFTVWLSLLIIVCDSACLLYFYRLGLFQTWIITGYVFVFTHKDLQTDPLFNQV